MKTSLILNSTWNPKLVVIALGALWLNACSDTVAAQNETDTGERLPRVLTVTTSPEQVTLTRSYAARTQGSKEVTVRARSTGQLQSRDYTEGQLVKQGDLLFTIEPDKYKVELQRAEAELQRAEAERADTERQWQRIQRLFAEGAVSQRDRDQGLANVELAQANYAAAQADVEQARINLRYTQVESPITGIAGRESVSVGNIVNSDDALTHIVQLDPLYVYFAVPQNDIAAQYLLESASPVADESLDSQGLKAQIERGNGQLFDRDGHIDFVSRTVDSETGTINVRAQIPNPTAEILPGQFTRVNLPEILIDDAIAIPQRALVQSAQQSIVYIVNAQQQIELREVIVGPRVGDRFIIQQGLAANEQVVVEGLAMLRAGLTVNAQPFSGE